MQKVTDKEFQALVSDYYNGRLNMTMSELIDNYEIVLETAPTHANAEINKLIETFCTGERKKDGAILYDGSARNYLGFDRYLPDGFEPMYKAFNGYREMYFSRENLCSVGTCEGDVTVCLYSDLDAYEKGYESASKFYDEY